MSDETPGTPAQPATPPPSPNPEDEPNPLLEFDTAEWKRLVDDHVLEIRALADDYERVAWITSLPRSRRGAMLRSLMHSTMTKLNEEMRRRTDGRPATKIFDRRPA